MVYGLFVGDLFLPPPQALTMLFPVDLGGLGVATLPLAPIGFGCAAYFGIYELIACVDEPDVHRRRFTVLRGSVCAFVAPVTAIAVWLVFCG